MSKKLIISAIGIAVIAVGGYFGASKMGLLGPNLADQAETMADTTCACENFDCTLEQTKWFNMNSVRFKDKIAALSEEDGARYAAAHSRNVECQNERRP